MSVSYTHLDVYKRQAYLSGAVSRIPSLEMHFCENRAADSVVGYYCALAKRENIPYSVQIDLPECLPVDEINLCLVLSNLLENALEASLRTAPARRRIKLTAYLLSLIHILPTAPVLAGLTLLAAVIYIKTLRISLWKSGTVALSVCAVFACINSLCRAINAAMLILSLIHIWCRGCLVHTV